VSDAPELHDPPRKRARTAALADGPDHLRGGGAVVGGSDAELEVEESWTKGRSLLAAPGAVREVVGS
jgi:anthranilate/para-aminobenzoate synthase component I